MNGSEKQLRLFSQVIEQTSEGAIITDSNGMILSVNPAFSVLTGYRADEVIGKKPNVFRADLHGQEFYHSLWNTLCKTGYWEGEVRNKRKNGGTFTEWLTIRALTDEQGICQHYAIMFKDISEQIKMKKDVILTGEIQRKLLPGDYADEKVAIRTIYKPARYVSGDFFEYIWNEDKTILFGYVADFMGHGMATAIQISTLRVLFHQVVKKNGSLKKKLKWVNKKSLEYFSHETFAAVICFEFDFASMKLTFASAGINYFLMASEETGVHVMKVPGLFLGIMKEASYMKKTCPIFKGDEFFFMSDGLFDILPPEWKTGSAASPWFQRLNQFVKETKQKDDVAVLHIKVK